MLLKIILAAIIPIGVVHAACPNSCSGHGTCGIDDVCTCYPGWGMGGQKGGDCSDRFCPYELAWVDGPTSDGRYHNYAECANKGNCHRETGECSCFPGYEGKSCGRQKCPENCSGHGTCKYMKDLTYGSTFNEYFASGLGVGGKKFADYSNWDKERARACVCDGGWTGIACNNRMCPVGNDIMDVIPTFDETSTLGLPGHGNEVPQIQKITLYDANLDNTNFASNSFALRFTSKLNESYVTQPIYLDDNDSNLETYIETALEGLPMKIIDDVQVSVDSTIDSMGVEIFVTFVGLSVEGKQNKLEVLKDSCSVGCTPLVSGLTNLETFGTLSKVEITQVGSFNSYECGRRGKCDYGTGICTCFEGYTGDHCSILTALY